MAGDISSEDWDEFVDVVTLAIVGHQEVSFIDTVALALKDGVFDEYKVKIFIKDHGKVVKTLFIYQNYYYSNHHVLNRVGNGLLMEDHQPWGKRYALNLKSCNTDNILLFHRIHITININSRV